MSTAFTTINPVSTGLAAKVGATVLYISSSGGAATSYTKYGVGDTAWCATPAMGGGEPVTADPRTGSGLARDIGARVLYVTGGVGTLLRKYGFGATEWCTWDPPAASHTHATSDVIGLGTAALVNTGTSAANVPTVAQADARYARMGLLVAMSIAPPSL